MIANGQRETKKSLACALRRILIYKNSDLPNAATLNLMAGTIANVAAGSAVNPKLTDTVIVFAADLASHMGIPKPSDLSGVARMLIQIRVAVSEVEEACVRLSSWQPPSV